MAYLVLVRHGKSEWNVLGKWTGLTDVNLAPEGIDEARRMGALIRDIDIAKIHVSKLKRAHQTLHEIITALGAQHIAADAHEALNERDYGIYTGKNKWQIKETMTDEEFHNIRRGWDAMVLEGENLKDVYARVIPYYREHILPQLLAGHNVLVVAHGNSLRALVKHLEQISDEKISNFEFNFGEVYCYEFDAYGKIVGKDIRSANSAPLKH
jgi:2,3-bisphosphoglycerate-dependent phosphoglycerate mutase